MAYFQDVCVKRIHRLRKYSLNIIAFAFCIGLQICIFISLDYHHNVGEPLWNKPSYNSVLNNSKESLIDSTILLRSGTDHVYNHEFINKPELEKLRSLKIPNIVHVVFCEKIFKFKHYISLFSVWKVLRPFRIIMHIQGSMISDRYGYNTWFKKANDFIPNIEHIWHNDTGIEETSCFRLGTGSLFLYGGILSTSETLFLAPILDYSYEENIHVGYTNSVPSKVAFIAAPSGSNIFKKIQQPNFQTKKLDLSNLSQCDTLDSNLSVKTPTPVCLHLSFELYPKDIFNLDSEFGSIIRNLVYGTKELLRPKKLKNNPIPKIVHYVWLGGDEITFPMYLSFLSTVKIIMPDGIYIHGDIQPRGIFWDKIMSVNRVVFVEYGPTHFVFGKRITSVQHESYVVRTDILYRYGGIYIDWDAYWLKPIDNLLTSGYEFIVAFDHSDRDPFPDSINLGIVLATPGASFLKRLEQSFKYFRGDHITYHAVEAVYKLYEEVPELVQIEPRLQVICYRLKCHPLWFPDYKNSSFHHTFDWTRDAYAIHFTSPLPPEFTNETILRASNETFFGKIGNHVINYN